MAKEQNSHSHIHVELALLALQRAMSGIRLIEGNDISISEFRQRLPDVTNELNKAIFFLSEAKGFRDINVNIYE